ncbi:sortase [Streptomyces sp. NPDC021969]|uniref:sortase domain-containing protein n=1 Tax=unclassified Streptomyces TaxID=2593676 RepID=UPI0033C21751
MRLLRSGGRRGALTAAATACASAGAGLLALAFQHELTTPPPLPAAAQATPRGTGLSQPPTAASVVLPRSVPQRITAPGTGLDTAIDAVGLAEDGSVALPKNVDHAGWFTGSVTPGERGNAIIVGHVDSTTGPAAFYSLGKLSSGDRITVQRRDGRAATFTLTRTAVYDKNHFPSDLVYGPTQGSQLTLITCTDWDSNAHEYRANLVLTAQLAR